MSKWIEWQTQKGRPLSAGDLTVTPESRALVLRWPGGGLVWNRPVAVLLQRGDQVERRPIVDVTRLAQWAIGGVGLGLGLALLGMIVWQYQQERRTP